MYLRVQGDAADSKADAPDVGHRQWRFRQGLRRSLRSAGVYALGGLIGATVCVLVGASDGARDSLRGSKSGTSRTFLPLECRVRSVAQGYQPYIYLAIG